MEIAPVDFTGGRRTMAHRYVCRDAGFNDCRVELHDESEEGVRRKAEEHLHKEHPHEAIDQHKLRGFILGGYKPA
jgi:hypothetical protein